MYVYVEADNRNVEDVYAVVWASYDTCQWKQVYSKKMEYYEDAKVAASAKVLNVIYDPDTQLTLFVKGHHIFYSRDCKEWIDCHLTELQTAGGAIVSLGNGRFAIWPDRNEGYTPVVDEYCVAVVSYDEANGFTVDDNVRFPSEVVATF